MNRPKLYPRCFMGWWVCEGKSQGITQRPAEYDGVVGKWIVYGDNETIGCDECDFLPLHDFGDIPCEKRCTQITEAMCEPDPQVLVDAAQAVIDRWHTPSWKDVEASAVTMQALEQALAKFRT